MKNCNQRNKGISNRGVSLVELICTVAVLGVILVAVCGAMIVSSKNYSNGITSVTLQQEAQTTSNLLTNLVIDSKSVTVSGLSETGDTDGTIEIVATDDSIITIAYDATTKDVTYSKLASGATLPEDGILASGVVNFYADASNYNDDKNVYFMLGLSNMEDEASANAKEFKTSFTVTSRNRTIDHVTASLAAISVKKFAITEPGNVLEMPCKVLGSADGFDVSGVSGNTSLNTYIDTDNSSYVRIVTGNDEKAASFDFVVTSKAKLVDADGNPTSTPADTKTIRVNVRRITQVKLLTPADNEISDKKGDVSVIKAQIIGNNLERQDYAYGDADYRNPYDVEFRVVEEKSPFIGWGNASNPGFNNFFDGTAYDVNGVNVEYRFEKNQFSLKDRYPDLHPVEFTIRVKAMHSYGHNSWGGVTNKSGNAYDEYVYADVRFVVAEEKGIIQLPDSGIVRGNDNLNQFKIDQDIFGVIKSQQPNLDINNTHWFMRVRTQNADGTYGAWSPYIATVEGSRNTMKMNATESYLFDPYNNVQLEMVLVNYTTDAGGNKIICWPNYPELLAAGNGFTERGYKFAWDVDAATYNALTSVDVYSCGNLFDIPKVDIYSNIQDSPNFNVVADAEAKTIDQTSIPTFTNSQSAVLNINMPIAGLDKNNICMNNIGVVLQVKDSNGNWVTKGENYSGVTYSQGKVTIDQNFVNNNGTHEYRFGLVLKDGYIRKDIKDVSVISTKDITASCSDSTIITDHKLTADERYLFDVDTGEGFIYFNTKRN